ncbi:hypothetical protein [Mesorhizobium sp.]|uniref:hypothetical protein n=1 Tax=Mesorhizobium sp. TaxID=1871066 RepID=UPI0025B9FA1C|nr:hypothetical protein [Mesorhizobium sp.]
MPEFGVARLLHGRDIGRQEIHLLREPALDDFIVPIEAKAKASPNKTSSVTFWSTRLCN